MLGHAGTHTAQSQRRSPVLPCEIRRGCGRLDIGAYEPHDAPKILVMGRGYDAAARRGDRTGGRVPYLRAGQGTVQEGLVCLAGEAASWRLAAEPGPQESPVVSGVGVRTRFA